MQESFGNGGWLPSHFPCSLYLHLDSITSDCWLGRADNGMHRVLPKNKTSVPFGGLSRFSFAPRRPHWYWQGAISSHHKWPVLCWISWSGSYFTPLKDPAYLRSHCFSYCALSSSTGLGIMTQRTELTRITFNWASWPPRCTNYLLLEPMAQRCHGIWKPEIDVPFCGMAEEAAVYLERAHLITHFQLLKWAEHKEWLLQSFLIICEARINKLYHITIFVVFVTKCICFS